MFRRSISTFPEKGLTEVFSF